MQIRYGFTNNIVADKKTFLLRIDDDVYKAIEKWANDEFRSVNGQLEWLIDKALKDSGRKKKDNKDTGKGKAGS